MSRRLIPALLIAFLAACGSQPKPSDAFPTEFWQAALPDDDTYLLAPGDKVEVIVHSAPELSRELVVAPDGRLRMPLAEPVTAIAHSPSEVARALETSLSAELRDPDLDVVPLEFASQSIFVGGEVGNPGMLDLPGQIDPLQAVIMAGGFTRDAKQKDVILMRRLPGGEVRTVVLDLKGGVMDPAAATWLPLRRFDVVYVPRTRISEQNQFVQQYIRNALPVEFSLFYDLRNRN
ncbi:MAG: polysaccharide export protein [Hyphomonas sp.]|nr:polysaccharide export protein [Hyphomonas sp.]